MGVVIEVIPTETREEKGAQNPPSKGVPVRFLPQAGCQESNLSDMARISAALHS